MIKPISGMSYVGKLSASMNGTDHFNMLFNKFFERKAYEIKVDIKYFRVNKVTKKELKFLDDKYPNLKELLFNKVKDFVIIDDNYATGNVKQRINKEGHLEIDMSNFDEDCSGQEGLVFILDINFNKPIGEVEINK